MSVNYRKPFEMFLKFKELKFIHKSHRRAKQLLHVFCIFTAFLRWDYQSNHILK